MRVGGWQIGRGQWAIRSGEALRQYCVGSVLRTIRVGTSHDGGGGRGALRGCGMRQFRGSNSTVCWPQKLHACICFTDDPCELGRVGGRVRNGMHQFSEESMLKWHAPCIGFTD
jgi:hypothetical protein